MSRRSQRRKIRRTLFDEQEGVCAICGRNLGGILMPHSDLDHIIPKDQGGANTIENLQLTHPKCNRRKSGKREVGIFGKRGVKTHWLEATTG